MPRWYYQRGEMRQTPSIVQGMDPLQEARHRREGARFIMELGSSMNLSLSTTMATAVAFFHRFYMCHSFQDFPRYGVGCACLFLAGKVEETPKKCKDMIEGARKQLDETTFIEQFGTEDKNRMEELMTLERILLQTIKFDLQLEHPYKYLLKYANCLKGEKTRLEKMVQMAWNFINDSLCTTLCLQWEPEIVAIALMHLACKLSKFEVSDWSGRTSDHLRWWDMFVEDMTIDVLEDICHQVLDFYSQTQDPPAPPDSPTPMNSVPVPANQSPAPGPPMSMHVPGSTPNSVVHPAYVQPHGGAFGYPQVGATATPPNSVHPTPGTNFSSNTHASSPIPMNFIHAAGGPPPFFTHQPPPPLMNSQPPQPLPPLPQQPPPPPPPTHSAFQPPLPS